eukprot:gene21358-27388_t
MGLGKTLQSISFVAHLVYVKKVSGPFLFIVPLSVLFNWMNEFRRWCPALNVLRMHSGDKDEQARLKTVLMDTTRNEVVLATYDTVKLGGLASAFKKVVWRAVFLDEGHRVRNEDSEAAKTCSALRSRFRVILTGTPLHNNLHEMGALLKFIAPNIFTNLSLFDAGFNLNSALAEKNSRSKPAKVIVDDDSDVEEVDKSGRSKKQQMQQIDRELLEKAHYMMRPFVLRRIKSEVEARLPPKLETKINCPMSAMQRELMQRLLFTERALIEAIELKMSASAKAAAALTATNTVPADSAEQSGDAMEVSSAVTDAASESTDPVTSAAITAKKKVNRELKGLSDCNGINKGDATRLQGLWAQLRKAANHPFLFPGNEKITLDGSATEDIVEASGKMKVLDKLLAALKAKGHRVVLFSQFTRTLDIISDYLDMRGYRHTRLDGSTNRVMREVRINLFNREKSNLFVFCLSTRAGGEGVNLFTADTVILFDSDWNPQVDIQAMARVHRIGQKKIVHIYRLVTTGTVEERIVQRAQKKLFLDVMVNRGSSAQALRLDDTPETKEEEEEEEEKEEEESKDKKRKLQKGADDKDDKKKRSSRSESSSKDVPDADAVDTSADAEKVRKLRAELAGDDEDGTPGTSKVFQALKFGWNSVFSATAGQKEISDADIAVIIDRRRGGLRLPVVDGETDTSSTNLAAAALDESASTAFENLSAETNLLEDQQVSLAAFDEHASFVDIRELSLKAFTEGDALDSTKPDTVNEAKSLPKLESVGSGFGDDVVIPPEDEEYSAAKYRPRRTAVSRTVEVMVEGLGMVTVMKDSYGDQNSGTALLAEHAKKKEALTPKQLLFIHNSGRQVAGRDFEHMDECQICGDGGDLLVCEMCPLSFHLECLGLDEMPTSNLWCCPQHECTDCARKASAAGLLFRCDMCELAYCEDCLPAEAVVFGDSTRLMNLGYKMPPNACYVHCSLQCDKLGEESRNNEREINQRKMLVRGKRSTEEEEEESEEEEEEEGEGEENEKGDEKKEKRPKKKKGTNSYSSQDVSSPARGGASHSMDITPVGKALSVDAAIDNCSQPDIRSRLERDRESISARFTSLAEVPHLNLRLALASMRIKALLLKVCHNIDTHEDVLALNPDNSHDAHLTDANISSKILEFKGVPARLAQEGKNKVFLAAVSVIAQATKFEVAQLSAVLGLSIVVPIKRAQMSQDPAAKGAVEPAPRFFYEPKFMQIKPEYNRKRHEEAIAAFLVVPTPQNLIMVRTNPLEKTSGVECATRCVLYSLRLLQSLGEYVIDANKQYFTAMTLLDEGMPGLNAWLPVFPSGRPADFYQKRAWVDPVCRLYKSSARLRASKDDIEGLNRSLLQLLSSQMPAKKAHVPVKVQTVSNTPEEEGSGDRSGSDYSDPDASSDDEEVAGAGGAKKALVPKPTAPTASGNFQNASMQSSGALNPNFHHNAGPSLVSQSHSLNLTGSSGFRLPGLNRGNIITGLNSKEHAVQQMAARQQQMQTQSMILQQYQAQQQNIVAHQQQQFHQQQVVYPVGTQPAVLSGGYRLPSFTVTQAASQMWQRELSPQGREAVLGLVRQLVESAAGMLGISSQGETDVRVQQFEFTLLTSASSASEYLDQVTLPSRLAALVQDYRKNNVPR